MTLRVITVIIVDLNDPTLLKKAFEALNRHRQENSLQQYEIYHPVNMMYNHHCRPMVAQYVRIGTVIATSLENAFLNSQNENNPNYRTFKRRSTSVGDVIVSPKDKLNNTCSVVCSMGFKTESVDWINHMDWGYIDHYIECGHHIDV